MGQLMPLGDALAPGARICASDDLSDGGAGVRFAVRTAGGVAPAFAVRHAGQVYAFLNRCAHKLVELDWEVGQFFDADGRYLMCATHGALYDPATGRCAGGPCRGGRLTPVPVRETDGAVWFASAPSDVLK